MFRDTCSSAADPDYFRIKSWTTATRKLTTQGDRYLPRIPQLASSRLPCPETPCDGLTGKEQLEGCGCQISESLPELPGWWGCCSVWGIFTPRRMVDVVVGRNSENCREFPGAWSRQALNPSPSALSLPSTTAQATAGQESLASILWSTLTWGSWGALGRQEDADPCWFEDSLDYIGNNLA